MGDESPRFDGSDRFLPVLRQSAAGRRDIEDRVQHLPKIRRPRATYTTRRRRKRSDQRPVRQITCIPRPPASIITPSGTIPGHPISVSRTGRHLEGQLEAGLQRPPWGTGAWELFDLAEGPNERADLSSGESERLAELVGDWETCAARNSIVWDPELATSMVYTSKASYLLPAPLK